MFVRAVKNNKGKRIAIFSHGYAIIYYLFKYCKLISVNADRNITFSFNDKVVFDKKYLLQRYLN